MKRADGYRAAFAAWVACSTRRLAEAIEREAQEAAEDAERLATGHEAMAQAQRLIERFRRATT